MYAGLSQPVVEFKRMVGQCVRALLNNHNRTKEKARVKNEACFISLQLAVNRGNKQTFKMLMINCSHPFFRKMRPISCITLG